MNLKYAILADAAQASPDGKFHLLGGGISIWWAAELPATVRVALVIGFEHSVVEAGRQRQIDVELTDEDGCGDALPKISTTIPLAGRAPHAPAGAPLTSTGIIDITTNLPAYGTYAFQVLVDGNHVGSVPLVLAPVPQELAQAS
jgi:hypothetical protein